VVTDPSETNPASQCPQEADREAAAKVECDPPGSGANVNAEDQFHMGSNEDNGRQDTDLHQEQEASNFLQTKRTGEQKEEPMNLLDRLTLQYRTVGLTKEDIAGHLPGKKLNAVQINYIMQTIEAKALQAGTMPVDTGPPAPDPKGDYWRTPAASWHHPQQGSGSSGGGNRPGRKWSWSSGRWE